MHFFIGLDPIDRSIFLHELASYFHIHFLHPHLNIHSNQFCIKLSRHFHIHLSLYHDVYYRVPVTYVLQHI